MVGTTAFDKCSATNGLDGLGYYTQNLIDGLKKYPIDQLYYGSFWRQRDRNKNTQVNYLGPFKAQAIISLGTGMAINKLRNMPDGLQLFHATDHYIPKLSSIPTVATIHDVIPFANPEWFTISQRILHVGLKSTMKWPNEIITVSEYSKKQIMKYLNIPESKISVIYNGINKQWFRGVSDAEVDRAQKKFSLIKPYFVFVGSLQERKNLRTLIHAFYLLTQKIGDKAELVVIGKKLKSSKRLWDDIVFSKVKKQVRFLGHLPIEDLQPIMKGGEALVFPSLREGFGLPIVEAFALGVPVVASNTSCIPEIAGAAALQVDPLDQMEMASAMHAVYSDKVLAKRLVFQGQRRARDFDWDKTSRETLRVYEHAIFRGK